MSPQPLIDARGLLSLWDIMHEHDASDWFMAARLLAGIRGDASQEKPDDVFSDEIRQETVGYLNDLMADAIGLGAKVSAEVIRTEANVLAKKDGFVKRYRQIVEITDTIGAALQAELSSIVFLRLSEDYVRYYRDKQLFGQQVADRFPSAISDIEEAGKCLAFGRGTAAVFHLMRVMELGLKVLAKPLGIPYAPSWESYIRQIETKLSEPHDKKPPEWKIVEPFYRELLGDFQAVKISWRNPTMHIVRTYPPEEADDVLRAVRTFMRRLATQNLD